MAADAIIFVFLGIAPWSNPWTVLDEHYFKMRVWHKEVPLGVQKDKYFSFHP